MIIPKEVLKKIRFRCSQLFGNEKEYFITNQDRILGNARKLVTNTSKKTLYYDIFDDEIIDEELIEEELIEDEDEDFIVDKLYARPSNCKESNWYFYLKRAKYSFGLSDIPYDWISHSGKIKIHHKARYLYLKKYEEKKKVNEIIEEVQDEINIEELRNLKVPTYDPRTSQI